MKGGFSERKSKPNPELDGKPEPKEEPKKETAKDKSKNQE